MRSPLARTAALCLLLWTLSARAEDPLARELSTLRTDFEYGKFREVFDRSRELIQQGVLEEPQLIELNKYAGLSAFNLDLLPEAESHLSSLLRLDPGFGLDPFVFAPATIAFLEKVRQRLKPELDAIRQLRILEAQRKRRFEEDRDRLRREAEEQRRKLEELARHITVRTVEKRSFLVNFLPFGAGQFQQGRSTLGILLASLEGALAATSLISYVAAETFIECKPFTLDDRLSPTGQHTVTVCGIPPARAAEARVWRTLKVTSGVGFYLLYAYGVADALYRHEDQVVTTRVLDQPLPAAEPAIPSASSRLLRSRPPPEGLVAHLLPVPGGLGLGITVMF